MQNIEKILNYRKNSDKLSTSGQPKEDEIKIISENGFEVVINIRPDFEMHYEFNEKIAVESLGMKYFNIPMTFDTLDSGYLLKFFELVESQKERRVFIHCHHNIRVSVLFAFYRILILKWKKEDAFDELSKMMEVNTNLMDYFDYHIANYLNKLA